MCPIISIPTRKSCLTLYWFLTMESSGAKVFVSCCQNHPAREASTTSVWFPVPHWLWLGDLWFSKWDSAVSRAATNVPGNHFEFPVRRSLASSLPAGCSTCSGKRNSSYRSSTARRSTQPAGKVEPTSSCHGTADGQRPHHHWITTGLTLSGSLCPPAHPPRALTWTGGRTHNWQSFLWSI